MAEKGAYTLDAVAQQVESWKAQGLKVVFTNGVFDVLHVGHVEVLEVAASHGQKLVVGVNSDASVRRLGRAPTVPSTKKATAPVSCCVAQRRRCGGV